eukprot:1728569-Pleurochrysis_carterae.AAC.3
MHRHCSISREQGFNDATECPTPIHYARLAQKSLLILYKCVRSPDSRYAPALIGACCCSMAFCGSAPRTAQVRSHSMQSGTLLSQDLAQMAAPGTVSLVVGAELSARRLYLTARATG